jgi:hypothetical protein
VSARPRSVIGVPKSRGRRKPAKNRQQPRRTPSSTGSWLGRDGYDVGRIGSSTDRIGGLLLSGDAAPDLMVELLLPLLWLEYAAGYPTNLCASSCATLHYAYAELGIEAHPRAVDLLVGDRRTDKHTIYGRPDPYWNGSTFHGHCVLWPPGSKRLIEPTVEQYPEIRRYQLGPICGRLAAGMGTPEFQRRIARGELVPGSQVGVQRGDLMLLYTAVGHEFDDVVMSGPPVRDDIAEVQRSGRNLAAQAINLLRRPEIIDRARHAPHAKVRALLDLLVDAETDYDGDGNLRFIVSGDPGRSPRQLDELELPAPAAAPPRRRQPAAADRPRRRGPLAWFRPDP